MRTKAAAAIIVLTMLAACIMLLSVPAYAQTAEEAAWKVEECEASLEEAASEKEGALELLAEDDSSMRSLEAEAEELEKQAGMFGEAALEAEKTLEEATPWRCFRWEVRHLKTPRYVRAGIRELKKEAACYEEKASELDSERQDLLQELEALTEKRESDLVALYRSRDGIASLEAEAEELKRQYEEALAKEEAERLAEEEREAERLKETAESGQASSSDSPGSGGSGTGSGGSSPGSSVSQEMARRGGMAGRLSIPSTGTSVALFYCDYSDGDRNQAITDAKDSAAYIPHEGGIIIADHVNQAFSGLKNVGVGTAMTIDYGSYTQAYTCVRTCTGTNYEGHLYDNGGNVIHSWLKGRIVLYTCQGGGVLITF